LLADDTRFAGCQLARLGDRHVIVEALAPRVVAQFFQLTNFIIELVVALDAGGKCRIRRRQLFYTLAKFGKFGFDIVMFALHFCLRTG